MRKLLKQFDDPKLARRIEVLRAVFVLLGALIVAAIVMIAAGGEMQVNGSPTGGRFLSDAVIRTIAWSDSPAIYLLVTAGTIVLCLFCALGLYLALEKLVEKYHRRRPLFRRRYPH